VDRELSTEEWFTIIARAWNLGIPQLIFTGGEPTLRDDLIPIIQKAEDNGQVTGLLTNGYRLVDEQFRTGLLESGLDHLLFALTPTEKESWFALQAILNEDLFTTVHITINTKILPILPQTIDQCRQYGANGISLSTTDPKDPALAEALVKARSMVAEADLPLKWDVPVPYSDHNPITMELEADQEMVPGAGRAWFYVEPDGDVLPGQGINKVLGNMLSPEWRQIWESGEE
jgi:MoaA/NifB/PqqE/SkfB family radical SAM enzyme